MLQDGLEMKLSRDIKVGAFVLAGLVFISLAVFLVGDERRFFSKSERYYTQFMDVQGLKAGAPVRMGGIDIGTVKEVGYKADAPSDPKIYVTLDVVASEAGRIQVDSEARIANKGLLGDKMIEIVRGKQGGARLAAGGVIPSKEPEDLFAKAGGMAQKANETMEHLHRITENIASEKFQADLSEAMASLSRILGQVAGGDGYPNRLLTSPDEANRISRTFDNLDRLAADASGAMKDVRSMTSRVQSGPGLAHDVIFGKGPEKQVEQFGLAAEELALTLRGVREGSGLMHDVFYGPRDEGGAGGEAVANLTALSADLRAIVADVRAGKGTLGALLVDPSIYEDLKSILGNVERNDVMRALVRYSIKQDESKRPVRVENRGASGEGKAK